MPTSAKDNETIERYSPALDFGLDNGQVETRKKQKLVNKTKIAVGKSYWQIIRDDVLSFFNILLFAIAIFILLRNIAFLDQEVNGQVIRIHTDLFFVGVLLFNIVISLYQDLKARRLMKKLRVVTAPRAMVIREGKTQEIPVDELVLDDLVFLKADSQICADSIVVDGSFSVNESLLTGEPLSIKKQKGDKVFSGSYVVSGRGTVRVEKVGEESYIETVASKANKFKRSPSKILVSLKRMFKVIGALVIIVAVATIIVKATQHAFSDYNSFLFSVGSISGSLVGMIPAGLYLLTSVTLAVGVISLAKKQAQVQDFYSIEMLSRANVLCIDKTGTITDGTMEVKEVVPMAGYSVNNLKEIMANYVEATKDDNATGKALKSYFSTSTGKTPLHILPFNSENKYSAVSYPEGTYVVGAPEFMKLICKEAVLEQVNSYALKGYRVLTIAKGNNPMKENATKYEEDVTTIGFVIIQDHIRENAVETFRWFKDNGVQIKVISGDNVNTVGEVAHQAGIIDHVGKDNCISLDGMNLEQVKSIANEYTVFSRVTPEQKEALIMSLKHQGKTVAMTGDGVNDILALKRADCSIAMASGAEAARNVSHIVLLNSDFNTLPKVVEEGRRVINNLQRTCSLFLVKTIFVTILSVMFLIIGSVYKEISYPFTPSNMYLWEIFTIGLAAFFLALEPNKELINHRFLSNIIKKALPGGLMITCAVLTILLMHSLNARQLVYTGIASFQLAGSMSVIVFSLLSIAILYQICTPFSRYRLLVFIIAALAVIGPLLGTGLYCGLNGIKENIFGIRFDLLMPVNLLEMGIITVAYITIYFVGVYIVKVIKEGKKNS